MSGSELIRSVPEGDVRERVRDLLRRAELLDWVSSIASDMTSRRDLDQVIGDICARLRRVTESDMAYVSVNSASETFIRYSSGIRTDDYRNIRMPFGAGVLGKAATGHSIVTTVNYVRDAQLRHLSDIDRRVLGEGVKSIIGVPMVLHDVVHGALLLADRREREYTSEIVDTLSTVALHTSAVLANAQHLSDVSSALARLQESHERAFLDALLTHGRVLDSRDIEGFSFDLSPRISNVVISVETSSTFSRVRDDLKEAISRSVRPGDAVVAFHDAHVCVLARSESEKGIVAALLERGREGGMGLRIGVSEPFSHPSEAKAAHGQADQALATLSLLNEGNRALKGGGLGAAGLLVDAMKSHPDAPSPLVPIEPLLHYDAKRRAELTRTAWLMAEYACHVGTVARKLHVHENTVRQRLEKIELVMGADWRAPERFLDIHVALRIWAVVNA